MTENLFGVRSFLLIVGHQCIDKGWKFPWIRRRNLFVFSNHNFLVQLVWSLGSEWWFLHCHFIQDTSQWPYVTFVVVWFFAPNLRRCIVRSSSLSHSERVFEVFSNVKITNFCNSIVEKYIGRLNVSVDDVSLMQFHQTLQTLVSYIPDVVLWNSGLCSNGFLDFALKVTLIGELHNNA